LEVGSRKTEDGRWKKRKGEGERGREGEIREIPPSKGVRGMSFMNFD
jgi:hypothetical protein